MQQFIWHPTSFVTCRRFYWRASDGLWKPTSAWNLFTFWHFPWSLGLWRRAGFPPAPDRTARLGAKVLVCFGKENCLLGAGRGTLISEQATPVLLRGMPLLCTYPSWGRTAGRIWPAALALRCGWEWKNQKRKTEIKTQVRIHLFVGKSCSALHKHELVLKFSYHCFAEDRIVSTGESHHGSAQPGTTLVEESLIHILSMGSKALMLQVWADLSTGSLTFRWVSKYTWTSYCFSSANIIWVLYSFTRICIDPNDEIKAGLLAQAESGEGLFKPGQWQHLGLTYSQQPEGKKNIHGCVVVWVCGIRWGSQQWNILSVRWI